MTIKPVSNRSEKKAFVDFPYELYRNSPYWVPPLRMDVKHTLHPRKNPFFEHGEIQLFLATNNSGKTVGRIAAIVNGMHLKKYDDGVGFFGFFECVEDFEVARRLVEAAEAWLGERGFSGMRGPTNPSMNEVSGLLVDGFDRQPSILMPYNPLYYVEYLERLGFTRAMTMWAYFVHAKYGAFEKLWRGRDLILTRYPDLNVRKIDMSRFLDDAKCIVSIYNEAWSENWGHVPMTDREFRKLAKDMKQVVEPDLVVIIEDKGRPIAFALSLPNLNQALRHVSNGRLFPTGLMQILLRSKFGGVHEVRTALMGVRKEYRAKGLDTVLVAYTVEAGTKVGYDGSEMSWILDNNPRMINHLKAIGGVIDKEYAMMEKQLERQGTGTGT